MFCDANFHSVQCARQCVFCSDFLSHMFTYCGYILASFIECVLMNNPLNPFITGQEMYFLIIWLIIIFFLLFLVSPVLLLKKQWMKNSGKITSITTYIHYIISKFQFNPFIAAWEMDFLIIISLFSFLFIFSSITGKVANEKFWKNHRVLLHIPTIS